MFEWLRRLWHRIWSSQPRDDSEPETPQPHISVEPQPSFPEQVDQVQDRQADQPLSLLTLQRTYTGLLDDVMIRYSSDYAGEGFFNKMILKNIVFGGGLFVNDGYLVNHPTARAQLYNDNSLLRVMLETNFIRVLTRESTADKLADMPHKMAASGNRSFIELCESSEWTEFGRLFRTLCQNFFHSNNVRPWPNVDMSHGFNKLIQRVLNAKPHEIGLTNVTEDQLQRMRDVFVESDPLAGNPRHKLEEAAKATLKDGEKDFRESMRQIMDLGNQAYHYNFGLTLTDEEENGVSVDTTMGYAFDEFLKTTEIESGQLARVPLIEVPDDLPFEQGDTFRPFLDHSTRIGAAKIEYLNALRSLLAPNARDLENLEKDVREATKLYLDRMQEVFGHSAFKASTDAGVTFARGLLPASKKGEANEGLVAAAAPIGGLAVQLQATATAESREFLVERFRLKDVSEDYDLDHDKIASLEDIRPQITSLAFNEKAAKDFVEDLPRFATS